MLVVAGSAPVSAPSLIFSLVGDSALHFWHSTTCNTTNMVTLRSFGHSIADSLRKLLRSPRSSPTKLFFKSSSSSANTDAMSDLSTPNSTRSVSFTEALTWPYIDEDLNE